jgi:hypothetical protein
VTTKFFQQKFPIATKWCTPYSYDDSSLSAHNTPQLDWAISRLARKVQPSASVFRPELGAEAIVCAALHPQRKWSISWPSLNRLWLSFADWYRAKADCAGQQSEQAREPAAPDKLRSTVTGPFGARGRFDAATKENSEQFWITTRRGLVSTTVCVLLVVAFVAAVSY